MVLFISGFQAYLSVTYSNIYMYSSLVNVFQKTSFMNVNFFFCWEPNQDIDIVGSNKVVSYGWHLSKKIAYVPHTSKISGSEKRSSHALEDTAKNNHNIVTESPILLPYFGMYVNTVRKSRLAFTLYNYLHYLI